METSDVVVVVGIFVAIVVMLVIVYEVFSTSSMWNRRVEMKQEREREGFADLISEEDLDIDELNEYREIVKEAYLAVLDRFPTRDEQTSYVRLLANDQTSFSEIVQSLKRTDEHKDKTDEISDTLPKSTQSMVDEVEEDEAEGDAETEALREGFRTVHDREPNSKHLRCMRLAVTTGQGMSAEKAAERCGDGMDEVDSGEERGGGISQDQFDEEQMQRSDEMPDIESVIDDIGEGERKELEKLVREAYEDVYGEQGEDVDVDMNNAPRWEPEPLTQQTVDMWVKILWKENGDVDLLRKKMRWLRKASMGFPLEDPGDRSGRAKARTPPGMDPDPYALAYILDADPLGRRANDEERAERRRRYLKERKESYGVGSRYDASTVEEALMERSRRMDAAELNEKREEDIRRIWEKTVDE